MNYASPEHDTGDAHRAHGLTPSVCRSRGGVEGRHGVKVPAQGGAGCPPGTRALLRMPGTTGKTGVVQLPVGSANKGCAAQHLSPSLPTSIGLDR